MIIKIRRNSYYVEISAVLFQRPEQPLEDLGLNGPMRNPNVMTPDSLPCMSNPPVIEGL